MAPRTRYARNGDTNLAYQVSGDGPIDVLFLAGMISHVETLWEEPGLVRFFERLGRFCRIVHMDRRGSGMSDQGELTLASEIEDVTAVLDAAGSERAAILAYTSSGPLAAAYAVAHPERVGALVLYACLVQSVADDELPWALSAADREARMAMLLEDWGEGSNLDNLAPTAAGDARLRAWLARLERQAASPGRMRQLVASFGDVDVRAVLPRVRTPTLVLHRTDDAFIDVRHSREYAGRIPGARLVELPGVDSLPSVGDTDALIGEVEEFLTGGRTGGERERALLTVLFTDIVDGTRRASQLGDKRWRDLLAAHDAEVRGQLARFGGREVKTVGDGFLAVFDGGPSRAVRAAAAIRDAVAPLALDVRLGLHTGECELIGDDVGGMAVHIAARVGALAQAGEVLVSGTVYGTVVGAGLAFEPRGPQELKGVQGPWPVFCLSG